MLVCLENRVILGPFPRLQPFTSIRPPLDHDQSTEAVKKSRTAPPLDGFASEIFGPPNDNTIFIQRPAARASQVAPLRQESRHTRRRAPAEESM